MQDLHAPFSDAESGWLATRARAKVLMREFDEYFDRLDLAAPCITRILNAARPLSLPVAYTCLGYRPPDEPSLFQKAMGWDWRLDGPDGVFPSAWQPREGEPVFAKPGWGALRNVGFERFLGSAGIQYAIIVGSLFDFGIRQTCCELSDRGVGSLVVSDAVISLTDVGQAYTSGSMAHGMTKLRSTGETLALLDVLRAEGTVRI